MRHTTSRVWSLSIALVVIVAGLIWLAVPSTVTSVVTSRLRDAGFADAVVTGASLGPQGIDIRRLQLAPRGAFILEDVRLAIDTSSITGITIGRLSLTTEIGADGDVVLPGYTSAEEPQNDVVDLVPDRGVRIDTAEVRLGTASGEILAILDETRVQRDSTDSATITANYTLEHETAALTGRAMAAVVRGGALEARLEITDGSIGTGGLRAAAISGTVETSLAATAGTATPVVELELNAAEAWLADMPLGRLSVDAALRDGLAEIDITTPARGDLGIRLTGVSLDDAAANGRLRLTGSGLVIPGLLRDGSFEVGGVVTASHDRLSLEATSTWTASFVPSRALLPAAMQGLAEQPAEVTITSRPQTPLALRLSWRDATAALDAVATAHLGQSRTEVGARLAASWETGLSVTADALALNIADLPWLTLTLGVDGFRGQAGWNAETWNVTGAGALRATGAMGALNLDALTAQWSGIVSGAPSAVTVTADACIEWTVDTVFWGTTRLSSLTLPCIRADAGTLLTYDLDNGLTRFNVATAASPLQARVERDSAPGVQISPLTITGTWPEFQLSGVIDNESGLDLSAAGADGALNLAMRDVAADGVGGTAEIRAGVWQSATLSATTIESRAEPAWWAPVNLEAGAERDDGAISFEALISDTLGTFVLEASGRAAGGRGMSELMLYPVQFVTGATSVADISPWLAETVSNANGMLAFAGEVTWGSDGIESTGRLGLEAFGATIAGIDVAGISTQTQLASLWPVATLPEQSAEISAMSLGMPLQNGRAVYDLDATGRLRIHSLAFDIAGGRIHTDAFTIDSGGGADSTFTLLIEDVELSQMFELSKINGLQGTGRLSGSIPVRISDRGVHLDDGRLIADSTGTLRYTPSDLPAFLRGTDQRTQMLREALTDFQYDNLSVTVSGDSGEGGQQTVRFNALGANPDFLDGHPIDLTFTFTGPLLGAMSSAASVAGAARIQDLFEQQQLNELENTQ